LLKNFDLRHLKTSSANFAPDVLTFDSGHFVRVPHFSAVDRVFRTHSEPSKPDHWPKKPHPRRRQVSRLPPPPLPAMRNSMVDPQENSFPLVRKRFLAMPSSATVTFGATPTWLASASPTLFVWP